MALEGAGRSERARLDGILPVATFGRAVPGSPLSTDLRGMPARGSMDLRAVLDDDHLARRGGLWRLRVAVGTQSLPGLRHRSSSVRTVVGVAPFEGAAREAVHALKYENKHAIAPMMGRLMARAARDLEADLVVPTTLHRSRRRERGYDQAGLLSRVIARELKIDADVTVLERVRRTKQQVALGPEERRLNVAGAFRVTRRLHGETVLLVDDVFTTGATIEAAATALLEGGARSVLGVVFGSAEIGHDSFGRKSGRRGFTASPPGRSTR